MQTSDPRRSLISGTALFAGLPDAEANAIAAQLRPVSYDAGQLIFSRGDTSRDLYLVTEGRVRLSLLSGDGRELSLVHAAGGELFGEMAALDGGPRSADATAIGAVKGFLLPQSALRKLIESYPRIADAAIRFLCRRLRETNEKLEAIALHPIEVRLARFLLAAVKLRGLTPTRGQVAFDLDMSQSELALLVGASRPKVNIALGLLEAEGAISRSGTKVTCTIAALEQVAGAE